MSEKISLARLRKFGKVFELSVDPEKALEYKKGSLTDLNDVLMAEKIFTDAKKGLVAGDQELEKVFRTTDFNKIAELIIKEGEVQATSEHRSKEREQKLKQMIELIRRQAVDPKTNFPHPANRIETALEEAKVHLDEHRSVEEQFDAVLSKLRGVLPLAIEQKKMVLTVPSQFSGKLYSIVHAHKVLKEDWLNNGDWKVIVEVPAGLVQEFIDRLNSLTHGQVSVELEK